MFRSRHPSGDIRITLAAAGAGRQRAMRAELEAWQISRDLWRSSAAHMESTQSFAEGGNVSLGLQVAFLEDNAACCQVFHDAARLHYCPSAWQVSDRKDACRHNGGWCAATWVEVDVELVCAFLG